MVITSEHDNAEIYVTIPSSRKLFHQPLAIRPCGGKLEQIFVLPHMRIFCILAHTRMGYPVRIWANIMSHGYVYGRPI